MVKMLSRLTILVLGLIAMAVAIEWKKEQVRTNRAAKVQTVLGELLQQGAPVVVQRVEKKDFTKRRLITLSRCGKRPCYEASRDELKNLKAGRRLYDPKSGDEIGSVTNISYQPSLASGLYQVNIKLQDDFGKDVDRPVALIEVANIKDQLVLPTAAIAAQGSETLVYRIDEQGNATATSVVLGEGNGHEFIVEQGLAVGDKVVVEGATLVPRFGKVNVLRTEEGE